MEVGAMGSRKDYLRAPTSYKGGGMRCLMASKVAQISKRGVAKHARFGIKGNCEFAVVRRDVATEDGATADGGSERMGTRAGMRRTCRSHAAVQTNDSGAKGSPPSYPAKPMVLFREKVLLAN